MDLRNMAEQANRASIKLSALKSGLKNEALQEIAEAIIQNKREIMAANDRDIKKAEEENLSAPLMKRLVFNDEKIGETTQGLKSLIELDDPVGKTLSALELDRGLELYKVSCPIGVIGVIFESRPDALVQISSLCLKSGNAVLMKGGSEAAETNRILTDVIAEASERCGIPKGWITLLESRADVTRLLEMDDQVNLIIPRGSNEFVRHIMDHTHIPVMGHADGICHVFVDKGANIEKALQIVLDSKCQYVAVCNALETLLVHRDIADDFLPRLKISLEKKDVEIRGCEQTRRIIDVLAATEKDWDTEYLDLILSIRIVSGMDEAINHINHHGSGHTDAIVTPEKARGIYFMDHVDSANVFLNSSTRFSDGFRYGLGAEVGISTHKIHARGPVGLEGLVIYKWRLLGDGHVVADYSGPDKKSFTHKRLDKKF